MITVRHQGKSTGVVDFHPETPFTIAPTIIKTFFSKDKVRMYRTKCKRKFIADVFDRMFVPAIVVVMKHKHFKSTSIDARVID